MSRGCAFTSATGAGTVAEPSHLPWGSFDIRYAAPETVAASLRGADAPVARAADLWALGLVLYELAAGRAYWQGHSDEAVVHALLGLQPLPHVADPAVLAVVDAPVQATAPRGLVRLTPPHAGPCNASFT